MRDSGAPETARYRRGLMSRATMWILGGIFAVVLAVCVAGAVLAWQCEDFIRGK